MDPLDFLRELDKIDDALDWASRKEAGTAKMNAAQHCNDKIFYSPLYSRLLMARDALIGLRAAIEDGMVKLGQSQVEPAQNKVLSVRIDEVSYLRLKQLADSLNVDMSTLVREAVTDLLDKYSARAAEAAQQRSEWLDGVLERASNDEHDTPVRNDTADVLTREHHS